MVLLSTSRLDMIHLIAVILVVNHLLLYHECRIYDRKSLPRDYIADGLKLHLVDKARSPVKLYKSGSHYKPVKGYGKDYDYEAGETSDDDFDEEFGSLRSLKDKSLSMKNGDHDSNLGNKFLASGVNENIRDNGLSKSPNDLPFLKPFSSTISGKSGESLPKSDPKDWRYQVCEEFLIRESGISKIPKALRYHVDIDDHKRLNVNPPIDKKEMAKCLRNLAIIRGTDSRLKGLDLLSNSISPSPFSAPSPSSSLIPSSASSVKWPSDNGDHQSYFTPTNVETNRARLISRLSEEQIRKLLLLLAEMLNKRIKPSKEIGKVPIHGKLSPLMFSNEVRFNDFGQRQPVHSSSIPASSGSRFPSLAPFSGNSLIEGGLSNSMEPASPISFGNSLGYRPPPSSSRGPRPYSKYSTSSYGPSPYPFSTSYSGFSPPYPFFSPFHHSHSLHPATQVTRFPFTSPNGVKKMSVNEVLGVKKIEKYNGEREVEVGGGPKTVVVHEGELHVDPNGESAAIEIDENRMKQYRDNFFPGFKGFSRPSGFYEPGTNFPGRSSSSLTSSLSSSPSPSSSDKFGSSFFDSFPDSAFANDPHFPSSGSSFDSSSSSQTEVSSPPISSSSPGRFNRDRNRTHRYRNYHHNNGNEYVYSSDHGSTSDPPPGVQITKCDESGTCTGSGGSIVNEEESIKSKYKANNSATRAAYGRYGAKYLGLTLTSIANYAFGNLMGVLYSPFMRSRDTDKNGKVKPDKRPVTIPIGGRPVKGMFDPTLSSSMGGDGKLIKNPNGKPLLDQEIENLIDDYDDMDGENNKARRRRRRRRR